MNTIPKGAPRRTGNRFRRAEISPASCVAYHESGHAVIAMLAARDMTPAPVISVEIFEDTSQGTGLSGICRTPLNEAARSLLEWSIGVYFAGGLAEAIHRGERNRRSGLKFALANCGMSDDIKDVQRALTALRLLTNNYDTTYQRYAGRVWDLLKANCSSARLASVLNITTRSGSQCCPVIRSAISRSARRRSVSANAVNWP